MLYDIWFLITARLCESSKDPNANGTTNEYGYCVHYGRTSYATQCTLYYLLSHKGDRTREQTDTRVTLLSKIAHIEFATNE